MLKEEKKRKTSWMMLITEKKIKKIFMIMED
jgi:hypothetical protein